ncbi:NAD(P)H-dependent oxidoreductase [Kosakonia sp. BK9b]|uniref:FMN-dependent NADH-azoreductase n=1 Tax=Kosakonia sp. TaxID=1916651 RepID=UPI00289756EE|nr:NAD(P)H-dependent oxidoreductase [Kosakonia sp.]
MKVLHLDASITGEYSLTRQLSREVVNTLTARGNVNSVIYRDLVKDEISHLTGAIAAGFRPVPGNEPTPDALTREYQTSDTLMAEFLASDVIVMGAPMYNFSVSSQLKAWLDRLAQPGKTFRYTAEGPIGLVKEKKVIIVSARGGFYYQTPLEKMDFQERYLRTFLGFLGITDIAVIRAEGASKTDEIKQRGIAQALETLPSVIDDLLRAEK